MIIPILVLLYLLNLIFQGRFYWIGVQLIQASAVEVKVL